MPNGVIGNTTDSGSVKSRFEPWLGNEDAIPPEIEDFRRDFFYPTLIIM